MAAKYWIKLYHEILHDPKMGKLPDRLWRRVIELFLLAGEFDHDGALPSIEEIAWTLRISEEECNETLQQLQRLNVAHCNDDETWVITHFADRQDASTSTERSKAHRERKRHEKQIEPLRNTQNDATETQRNVAPDTDIDIDKDINQEESKETRHPDFAKVCQVYQYEIGGLSQSVSDTLNDDIKTYSAAWVIEAMKRAAKANVRNMNYVEGVLRNWQAIGGPQNDKPRSERIKNGAHHGQKRTQQDQPNSNQFTVDDATIQRFAGKPT